MCLAEQGELILLFGAPQGPARDGTVGQVAFYRVRHYVGSIATCNAMTLNLRRADTQTPETR